jgi:anti-sigma B factor antagonist
VIAGVFDAVTASALRPSLDAVVADRRASVTLDLSSLRRIDSSGIGLLVGLLKRCRTFGGAVRIAGAKDQPLSVMRLLRLEQAFTIR